MLHWLVRPPSIESSLALSNAGGTVAPQVVRGSTVEAATLFRLGRVVPGASSVDMRQKRVSSMNKCAERDIQSGRKRYSKGEKRKASNKKWNQGKGKARHRRYRQSSKGKEARRQGDKRDRLKRARKAAANRKAYVVACTAARAEKPPPEGLELKAAAQALAAPEVDFVKKHLRDGKYVYVGVASPHRVGDIPIGSNGELELFGVITGDPPGGARVNEPFRSFVSTSSNFPVIRKRNGDAYVRMSH